MSELFYEDHSTTENKKRAELRDFFEKLARNEELPFRKDKLPNKLNHWGNVNLYEKIRTNLNISSTKNHLSELYDNYNQYTDGGIQKDCGNFKSKCFELIIASRINLRDKLKIHLRNNRQPDLTFENILPIECAARETSVLDKYADLIPMQDYFYKASHIFLSNYDSLKKNGGLNDYPYLTFESTINAVFVYLTKAERLELKKILNCAENEIVSKMYEWITYSQHAYFCHRDILPEELQQKTIIKGNILQGSEKFIGFIINSIANKVIEKLSKPYFETPAILAISFSTLFDFQALFLFEQLNKHNVIATLPSVLHKKLHQQSKKIELTRLKNLYGIIIDASQDNWKPCNSNTGQIANDFIFVQNSGCTKTCFQTLVAFNSLFKALFKIDLT